MIHQTFIGAIPLNYRIFGDIVPVSIEIHIHFDPTKDWRSFSWSEEKDLPVWLTDERNHVESTHLKTMKFFRKWWWIFSPFWT